MKSPRQIEEVLDGKPTVEGAGVHLKRAFGNREVPRLDPFLLLDDFHSDRPPDYLPGFPWHPHRGIETVTYVLQGRVEHGDSLGNSGFIEPGDIQWMTAGSGIVHQEMPKGDGQGRLWGFQLWVNLPAADKMMAPRYRDVKAAHIPLLNREDGSRVRVIAGQLDGVVGPVRDIVVAPQYLDVTLPGERVFEHPVPPGHRTFTYVVEGSGEFDGETGRLLGREQVGLFGDGDGVHIRSRWDGVRFLLVSGRPLKEPVAWYGPIVMNTQEELELAFLEYRTGTFLKHQGD